MLRIGSPLGSSGLGDITILTAICKQAPCIVELPPKVERFARIFKGLAEVEIKENPTVTGEAGGGLYIKRKLRFLSLNEEDCLPKIVLDEEDKKFVAANANTYNKTIAFVPNCSAQWAYIRETKKENWLPFLEDFKKDGFRIIQFGISSNITDFGDLVDEVKADLSVEELIRYFAAIGKYVGVETGDLQVMAALSGKIYCFYPNTNLYYSPLEWQYKNVDSIYYFPFEALQYKDK